MRCWNVLWIVLLCLGLGCSRKIPQSEPSEEASASVESVVEANGEAQRESVMADAGKELTPEPPPEKEPPGEREPPQDIPPVSKYPQDGLKGTVVHITDGDTIYLVMQPGGWASRVRLKGVNAPECNKREVPGSAFQSCVSDKEYYGLKSFQFLKNLLSGAARRVIISCIMKAGQCEEDDFGRFLAYLTLPDGRDAGQVVMQEGAAFAFTRYSNQKMASYCQAEADAIRTKKGMWSKGRSYIKQRMSSTVKNWYYNGKNNHDAVCSSVMKKSFAKAAGE